jgi:two-component system, OmpR family, sensor histidine kinase VanS
VSVRLKLALSYAGFLVAAGIALAIVLLLVLRYIPDENIVLLSDGRWVPNRGDLLQVFWRWVPVALIGLAVVGVAGGWLLAGRMLAPLARVHAAAVAVESGSLDHRIRMSGPRDEMRELADAFDAMVARLERTFDEQQRFAANASHELRTPHAVIRTMLEVAQADPDGTDTTELLRRLTATNERAIASTESLLALARVEREPLVRSSVDLAALTAACLADVRGVEITTRLDAVTVSANPTLTEQLIGNLVRNAVMHNVPGGHIDVVTETAAGGGGRLTIENSGPVLDAAVVATLTEPFLRAQRHGPGSGLGLAIVASIVRVHDGDLTITRRVEGGLRVSVTLPRG